MESSDINEGAATRVLRRQDGAYVKKLRHCRLRIQEPGAAERLHLCTSAELRVGSREGNDLTLRDESVSRLHCAIQANESGFRLRDLGSRNGTWINGMRVFDAVLPPTAQLRIGSTVVHFEMLRDESEVPIVSEHRFERLVGQSLVMRELFATLARVAPTDATVVIEGESGTGKELVAEAIHRRSSRADGPFVIFDCASVSSNLLESELFGHERGAFTGAERRRTGCVEDADKGTLFLDEIGELPLALQPKLLRLLQNRQFRRVGSNQPQSVDVRVVAATNRDLASEVNRGGFREDLYYRLAVVRLQVPPLRDRREDVPILVRHLALQAMNGDEAAVDLALQQIGLEGWRDLQKHNWPGNVRELGNTVQRLLALGAPGVSHGSAEYAAVVPRSAELNPALAGFALAKADPSRPLMEQKRDLIAAFEEAYLEGQLQLHGGNISRAAEAAGVERMYFKRLMRKYPSLG